MADTEGSGELESGQVVDLGEEQRGPLALGDARKRSLEVAGKMGFHHEMLGGWRRSA